MSAKNPFLNHVIISGRLTRDPELRHLSTGTAKCDLSIAITEYYKQNDERKEKVHYLDVVAWTKMAEYAADKMRKGDDVVVQGKLSMDQWEDRNTGEKKKKIQIIAHTIQALNWPDDGKGESRGGSRGAARGEDDDRGGSRGGNSGGYGGSRGGNSGGRDQGGGRNVSPDDDGPIPEDDIPF